MKDYINLKQYTNILRDNISLLGEDFIVAKGMSNPHSWRGSYYDVSFEPKENITLGDMYDAANDAIGTTYRGYKGGEFYMSESTMIHEDYEGGCSCDGLTATDVRNMIDGDV